jgi:hypothetical protein
VALVEVFAVLIAVMYATHSLRAKQKPVAMMVEAAWFVFAAVNLALAAWPWRRKEEQ